MHQAIERALATATKRLRERGKLPLEEAPILVQPTPAKIGGDYATNLALVLAPMAQANPVDLAQDLVAALPPLDGLTKTEIAPPGFINFYCRRDVILKTLVDVLAQGENFGTGCLPAEEKGKKILVEYVSANPTGPLHIGHGRAAALGSALVNVMNFAGYEASGEYYVNDGGRQMKILTASLCLRLMQLARHVDAEPSSLPSLPPGFYQGDYLEDLAREWRTIHPHFSIGRDTAPLLSAAMDQEERIDKVIAALEKECGTQFDAMAEFVLAKMMRLIKRDLVSFATHHHSWYYESETADEIRSLTENLRKRDFVYERDGALWFRSRAFEDDKDRVVQRSDGRSTYFLHDIAYHDGKYRRGYDRFVDLLGSDHHGYMKRIRASMQALDRDPTIFSIHLVQFVSLMNDGKDPRSMSTRANQFVSLQELVAKVGVDAARFFFLMYRADQPLKFDVKLAVARTKDNPVYYVQYAHARILSLFAEASVDERRIKKQIQTKLEELELLKDDRELQLAAMLNRFPTLVATIARNYEIYQLTNYLRELAREFHGYYNDIRILGVRETTARLCLCAAVRRTLANGLGLLGVNAPVRM